MSDSDWTIAFSLATFAVTGLAFLSWNAPALFARLALKLIPGITAPALIYVSFIAGANIALGSVAQRPDVVAAQHDFALSGKLGYLLAFVTSAILGLTIVAKHRSDQHGDTER